MIPEREKYKTSWRSGNELPEHVPFDHSCPQQGTGLNTHKARCEARQKLKANKSCYPNGCKQEYRRGGLTVHDDAFWTDEKKAILAMMNDGKTNDEIMKELKITRRDTLHVLKGAAKKCGRLSIKERGQG